MFGINEQCAKDAKTMKGNENKIRDMKNVIFG